MGARPKHALSEDRLAELVGISDTTWRKHKAQGCPVPATKGDLVTWLPKYHQWRQQHGKTGTVSMQPPVDPETRRHRRDAAKWRAVLMQLEVGVRTGRLISRALVIDGLVRANITCRTRMNLMVAKTRSVHGEEVARELQIEVDALCAAFAAGMLIEAATETTSTTTTRPASPAAERTDDVATGAARAADVEDLTDKPTENKEPNA